MRIGLHDEGLVLLTPEIPGEPSEAVRRERGGNGFKRIRGFAHSGDSFRRSRFRRASGGPIFSVLPEKMGEKRGAGVRLVRTAGAVQFFLPAVFSIFCFYRWSAKVDGQLWFKLS